MADQSLSACVAEIKANPGKFYVYVLSRPDRTPFYVGVGAVRRNGKQRIELHEHEASLPETKRSNKHKRNTILQILSDRRSIGYLIDSWHGQPSGALNREVSLISRIGRADQSRGPLTNWTAGGEGFREPSAEERKKISDRMRRLHSDPGFAKRRDDRIAMVNADAQLIEKNRIAVLAANQRPEIMERTLKTIHKLNSPEHILESTKRIQLLNSDPEFRRAAVIRSRAVMLRNKEDPEFHKRQAEAMRSLRGNETLKENSRESWRRLRDEPEKLELRNSRAAKSMTAKWNDPAFRKKMLKIRKNSALQSAEYRAKRSALIKAKWSDPEYRKKTMDARRASFERKKDQR